MSGDFGLLHAVDERLAAYGFETNTGVRFVAVVDVRGRGVGAAQGGNGGNGGGGGGLGLREGEMKLVSWIEYISRPTLPYEFHDWGT